VEEQLPFADSSDMTEYEGVVHITREPDMDEPPYYGAPHSTYGRFTGHREHEDGSFAEASPVEAWNDVEEAIKWGRTHAPMVVVRLGNTLDTLYSAGEIDAPECRPGLLPNGSRRGSFPHCECAGRPVWGVCQVGIGALCS
jgi:hypothetical protein